MDPWKPIRLWLCIAVIVAFLAVGGWARFWWGVPEAPYGYTEYGGPIFNMPTYRVPLGFDPFPRLKDAMEWAELEHMVKRRQRGHSN